MLGKKYSIYIEEDNFQEFREYCDKRDYQLSRTVNSLIKSFLKQVKKMEEQKQNES